ncbi:MAG TPA: helix-hairpin-helix domain-containing protein [Anaerolineae bacterium]|nr:helix-hairpin-helix domain-containing protein [Anaerolineae bacterium]
MPTPLRYRGYIILTLIYAIFFAGYVVYERRPQPEPIQIIDPTPTPTQTPTPIHVHMTGAVQRPGVYLLPPQSRLFQAVDAAGGLTSDADPERVNLADRIQDAQQVFIPRLGKTPPPSPTPIAASLSRSTESGQLGHGLININTASAAELDAMPGIGPVYAARIIAYREAHGPFSSPAEIVQVKGIGTATYEEIKSRITVD